MISGALLLLPDFGLILLGKVLRRVMRLGDHFWSSLEKLIYYVLFPALLFNALARAHIEFAATAPLVLTALAALLAGVAFGLLARVLFAQRPMAFASQFQCAFRYNSYIGLAVAAKVHGVEGITAMGIIVGTMVPVANFLSVWMLARHGNQGLARELIRNPLIIATLSGLAFNALGLTLPEVLQQFLARLSEAAIALGLLAVGAALKLRGKAGPHAAAVYFMAVKLLVVPAVAWGVGLAFGLQGAYFDTVVLFGALPTATSAYILAVRMGGDGPGVAWLVSASTLGAMLTLPVWLSLLAP